MYAKAERKYRNAETGDESMILRDVVGDRVTLKREFDVGGGRGTWRGSPFKEIDTVVPDLPSEIRNLRPAAKTNPNTVFAQVARSIEGSWSPNHFHVIPHSSGWDSRIISGAIVELVKKRGREWLEPGIVFIGNRWEAAPFRAIMQLQGWIEWAVYESGKTDEHFASSLDFETFWRTTNAPTPVSGNLRWYLIDWAQSQGILPNKVGSPNLQVYTGLWANETWDSLCSGGVKEWVRRHDTWYCFNQMAALPWKAELVEYPLSDVNVLREVLGLGDGSGGSWRERVSKVASPDTVRIARDGHDDWKKPIAGHVIKECRYAYADSWYAENAKRDWVAPMSSHWSNGWGEYGLASLCEALVGDGVEVVV